MPRYDGGACSVEFHLQRLEIREELLGGSHEGRIVERLESDIAKHKRDF